MTTSKYDNFVGAQYSQEYLPKVDVLLLCYKEVINQIDENMDMVNLKRVEYVNAALRCDGIIGSLATHVNQKICELENLVN